MNGITLSSSLFSSEDLNTYVEKGNNAIRSGNENESLKWYSKGLKKAKELKNLEKERLFSTLIITLI